MRAKQFLIEYNIKKRLGSKILDVFKKESRGYQSRALGYSPDWNDPEKILDTLIAKLEAMDPTSNKQYVPWLASVYAKQPNAITHFEDIDASAIAYLEKYQKLKQKNMLQPPRNNIYFFDNYGNFLNVMDEYPDPDKKIVNTSKGEYKTVYKDPVVEVIQPLDREAACYWGSEDWCTARPTGTNYFASYNSKGPLYILIPKNPKHPGERYQFQFEGNQFKDENNEDVNLNEMFKKFAGFFNWVKNNIPKANKYILFASAELINELTRIIGKRVIEYIYDVVDKMERNDDRFTDWQIEGAEKFGYINSEGDIDWDKVNDDPDLGYFRYNAHAWNLIDSAKDFLKIKPNEVLRAAAEEEIGTIDLLIYAYHNLALDITVDTAKFIENNIRIVNRDDFERSVHSKTPHKLLGRAGDYDVLGGRFGWASLT